MNTGRATVVNRRCESFDCCKTLRDLLLHRVLFRDSCIGIERSMNAQDMSRGTNILLKNCKSTGPSPRWLPRQGGGCGAQSEFPPARPRSRSASPPCEERRLPRGHSAGARCRRRCMHDAAGIRAGSDTSDTRHKRHKRHKHDTQALAPVPVHGLDVGIAHEALDIPEAFVIVCAQQEVPHFSFQHL
jgi:hypothetical protein